MRTASVTEAARLLRDGKVALVPTETVVGLVATDAGLRRIREIKGRDRNKPVALLCASAGEAFAMARDVPALARKLADLYWPGALTLVLDTVEGGTIGVRVPDHPTVRALLASYNGALYATSANLSGEPAPRALEEVDPHVLSAVDVILEGRAGSGEASAVVDLSRGGIRLLRVSGGLTEERLRELAGT